MSNRERSQNHVPGGIWTNVKLVLCSTISVALFRGTLVCFTWICLHHAAAYLYLNWCASFSMIGILFSPLTVISPHCVALRWIMNNAAIQMTAIAAFVGGYLSNNLEKLWTNQTLRANE